MLDSEKKQLVTFFFSFLYSDENMQALEELTASLKNAMLHYTVDSETPNGVPLYDIFCDEYNQLMLTIVNSLEPENPTPCQTDMDMLIRLAEYGARRGNPLSYFAMSVCYLYGFGVAQSLHQSLYFMQLYAAINRFYLALTQSIDKGPESVADDLLAYMDPDHLYDQNPAARRMTRQNVINFLRPLTKDDFTFAQDNLFNALYLASHVQMYITKQPYTPNLLTLDTATGTSAADYIAMPTEYTAMLSQMLSNQKSRNTPNANNVELHLQTIRSLLKNPFPAECRQQGHAELMAAERGNGRYAMEHWNTAVSLYLSAAMQGDAEAAAGVGYCCEHVPEGFNFAYRQLAMQWFQHAAKAGSAWAMQRVGEYYEMGLCGPVDHEMAQQCYDLARKMGMPARA